MESTLVLFLLIVVASLSAAPTKDCNAELNTANGKQLLGAFKPKCNEDGTYQPEQCHEGYCYCVFQTTGEKVLGTSVRFGHPKSCERTKCVIERHETLKRGLLGSSPPQCSEDGKYETLQCHHDGFCKCVLPETGEKILGVTAKHGQPESCVPTKCVMERHTTLKQGLLGSSPPQCSEDGNYEPLQCHHDGFCKCVLPETGEKLLGVTPKQGHPELCKLTKCVLEKHNSLKKNLLGSFRPSCNPDGTYADVQCHAGYCYCVFPTGETVLGTTKQFQRPKSCELTKCILERHGGWKLVQRGLLGVFVSDCDEDGQYKPVQCRKGMCWCVQPEDGKPIENTHTVGKPNC